MISHNPSTDLKNKTKQDIRIHKPKIVSRQGFRTQPVSKATTQEEIIPKSPPSSPSFSFSTLLLIEQKLWALQTTLKLSNQMSLFEGNTIGAEYWEIHTSNPDFAESITNQFTDPHFK